MFNFVYFFESCDDAWYASLFTQGRGKVKGEVTPAYSILNESDVRHVHRIMPRAKILYFIRNPIQRAWSSVRKRSLSSRSIGELKRISDNPALELRGDYLRTLSIWRSFFPSDQFFLGFFDEIVEDPEGLLLRIYDFLGLEAAARHITPTASKQINASPSKEIPDEFSVYLARKYSPMIRELVEVAGGYATKWLEDAESAIRDFESASPDQTRRPSNSPATLSEKPPHLP